MEKEHLHLLIHEEIYQLPSDQKAIEDSPESSEVVTTAKTVEKPEEVATPNVVQPKPPAKKEIDVPKTPEVVSKTRQDAGFIKEVKNDDPIPFAVFHSSTNEQEIALLHKIIAACKLSENSFKIFDQGFDQSIKFKKALVFVPEARGFYTPIPYKGSHFLCSKPLDLLINDQNEKGKLWNSLQKFVIPL